ncbi:virulence factor [Vibrio harveyi]|uniref:virulence factor n=1 Tax=Vibrio harveyi TaxID=669 RepID=UPI000C795BF7|nr:virulence factor [Vibrio harveyi]AWB00213.1 virulence factor [Vibrio harveyi]
MSYAIAFDLDTDILKKTYPNSSWNNAYGDIAKTLNGLGFIRQQGSVYFGDENVNAVKCVLAAQKLASDFAWFAPSVRDIRMLRIEEMNDLSDAI